MLPVLIVIACALSRLIPHPPNVTPLGATAVFAGRSLPPLGALALTWSAMALADLGLTQLQGLSHAWNLATPFVYAGFALQAGFGRALRARRFGALTAAGAGALGFFVLSNFGVWLGARFTASAMPGRCSRARSRWSRVKSSSATASFLRTFFRPRPATCEARRFHAVPSSFMPAISSTTASKRLIAFGEKRLLPR